MQTNGLYFICPLVSEPYWIQNISFLSRWQQFDRLFITVAQGEQCAPFRFVQDTLAEYGVSPDYLTVVKNDPELREAAWLPWMLKQVRNQPGITWYGHTKGVTRSTYASPVRLWTEACYETTLSKPDLVQQQLQESYVTGPFRRDWTKWPKDCPSKSTWHFSGTFFWFRNDALFSRDWDVVEHHRYGAEAYPSCVFERHESSCLFLDNCGDLYNGRYWKTQVLPELHAWRDS